VSEAETLETRDVASSVSSSPYYRVSSYYYTCVLILIYVTSDVASSVSSSSYYRVSSYYYMCPQANMCVIIPGRRWEDEELACEAVPRDVATLLLDFC
jgi:hypothetical protein